MKDPHEAYNEHVSSVEEALPDNPTTTGEEILKDVKANSPYAMVREHAAQALDNPATGEWTVDWLYEYARQREGYKTICELHNAEREKFKQEYELHLATIEYTADLREQLAAEREKWKQENALHLQAVGYYGASQKALAAEREKVKRIEAQHRFDLGEIRRQHQQEADEWTVVGCNDPSDNHMIGQQLAAEREKHAEQIGTLVNQRSERDMEIKQLREQLAAERKKLAKVAVDTAVLESQLAAAVELLETIRTFPATVTPEQIDAALSRIGGK